MALTQTEVSQLYVSVFGRASEGEDNTYWQSAGTDMITTANTMLSLQVSIDYFGAGITNEAFVALIYTNTLGKSYADDPEGQDYWAKELNDGKSKGEMVAALISAATDPATAGDAQDQFNNQVAVSNYTADTIELFTDTATFTGFISGVDHTAATVTAAEASVDTYVPKTLTLTTGDDTFTPTTTVVADQTANGNDVLNADVLTWNAGDVWWEKIQIQTFPYNQVSKINKNP